MTMTGDDVAGRTGFPHLLSPLRVRGIEIRNRFVFQPHFNCLADVHGMPTPDLTAYLEERAWGGAGLIVDAPRARLIELGGSRRRYD